MRSEHGNKPWTTHSKLVTHGGTGFDEDIEEFIATWEDKLMNPNVLEY